MISFHRHLSRKLDNPNFCNANFREVELNPANADPIEKIVKRPVASIFDPAYGTDPVIETPDNPLQLTDDFKITHSSFEPYIKDFNSSYQIVEMELHRHVTDDANFRLVYYLVPTHSMLGGQRTLAQRLKHKIKKEVMIEARFDDFHKMTTCISRQQNVVETVCTDFLQGSDYDEATGHCVDSDLCDVEKKLWSQDGEYGIREVCGVKYELKPDSKLLEYQGSGPKTWSLPDNAVINSVHFQIVGGGGGGGCGREFYGDGGFAGDVITLTKNPEYGPNSVVSYQLGKGGDPHLCHDGHSGQDSVLYHANGITYRAKGGKGGRERCNERCPNNGRGQGVIFGGKLLSGPPKFPRHTAPPKAPTGCGGAGRQGVLTSPYNGGEGGDGALYISYDIIVEVP